MAGDDLPTRRDNWDFYADPAAVASYVKHRDAGGSRNSLVEEPTFLAEVGDVRGQHCLDLGCGFGHYAQTLSRAGAASVVAVDRSSLMLAEARARTTEYAVEYILADIASIDLPQQSYDVVISNLTFHYLPEPEPVLRRAHGWLRGGGRLVFSVEHPIFTASREEQQWCDQRGAGQGWIVTDYFDEHDRWGYFGRKYHHTLATWVNSVVGCGFQLTRIAEPDPSPAAMAAQPELAEDSHRPLFLIVSGRKPDGSTACA